MPVDEDLYECIDELKIKKSQPHGTQETGLGSPQRTEAVAHSETAHFRVATICLAVLSFALLISVIVVVVQYIRVYNELMGFLKNRTLDLNNYTLEMEQLQSQIQNLTALRELNKDKENMMSCPDGWTKFGCSCYYSSNTGMSWGSSKQQCINAGGYLVVINSEKEMLFLNRFGAKFWIGLSRPKGFWQWTDERAPAVTFWLDGHPQPLDHKYRRNCAVFNVFHTSLSTVKSWSSEHCANFQKWVCEKEATVS